MSLNTDSIKITRYGKYKTSKIYAYNSSMIGIPDP